MSKSSTVLDFLKSLKYNKVQKQNIKITKQKTSSITGNNTACNTERKYNHLKQQQQHN